jgi:hypothetical protein
MALSAEVPRRATPEVALLSDGPLKARSASPAAAPSIPSPRRAQDRLPQMRQAGRLSPAEPGRSRGLRPEAQALANDVEGVQALSGLPRPCLELGPSRRQRLLTRERRL